MEDLKQYQIGKKGMLAWLDDIEAKNDIAISLYLPAKSAGALSPVTRLEFQLPDVLIHRIETSPTGAALLYSQQMLYVVLPPFPIQQSIALNRCEVNPLRDLLKNEFVCAMLLIRLGAYTIAVTQGETLLTAKAGSGNVHARHRQGGSSAKRFQRHREKQIEYFFTRICGHAREIIEPFARQLHFVILDGEDQTIRTFRQQCRFTETLSDRILDRKLDIREPRRSNLDKAIYNLWSTRIIEWPVPQDHGTK
jgi:hypothetical protein